MNDDHTPQLGGEKSTHTGAEPALSVEVLIPKLLEALNDPDWRTQHRAILLLGRTRDPRALPVLLDMLLDREREIRAAAAEALGLLGSRAAVPDLIDLLENDYWPYVRAAAATALGRIGHPDSAHPLQRAFRDRHPAVTEAAYEALQIVRSHR